MRFHGEVGYGETVENPPGSGVYEDVITERLHQGDVTRNARQLVEAEKVNKDISVSGNLVSIVSDAYSGEHFMNIRYVKWYGVLWTVTEVEVQPPRLLLRLGGPYNGPTPAAP